MHVLTFAAGNSFVGVSNFVPGFGADNACIFNIEKVHEPLSLVKN
jgi:hypothetical protein